MEESHRPEGQPSALVYGAEVICGKYTYYIVKNLKGFILELRQTRYLDCVNIIREHQDRQNHIDLGKLCILKIIRIKKKHIKENFTLKVRKDIYQNEKL